MECVKNKNKIDSCQCYINLHVPSMNVQLYIDMFPIGSNSSIDSIINVHHHILYLIEIFLLFLLSFKSKFFKLENLTDSNYIKSMGRRRGRVCRSERVRRELLHVILWGENIKE